MSGYPYSRITLQVGERKFTTYRRTLINKSAYFAARIGLHSWDDKYDKVDIVEDGSYFIDADPNTFEHILNYLRSGDYPILFNTNTSHWDYPKYMALLSQARLFEIRDLRDWIERKEYRNIVPFEEK
ncbi:BTB/POZ protein [Annulohypoxylon moriforme]|nr:BTB/POZ protein [Annulohypoxylon moriforme]